MAYYTEPTANDTLGIYEFFNYVNFVSGGLFFPVILMVIWLVTFIALKGYTTSRAWTGASFLISILAIPLAVLKLISPRYMYLAFMFLAGGLLWMKIDK